MKLYVLTLVFMGIMSSYAMQQESSLRLSNASRYNILYLCNWVMRSKDPVSGDIFYYGRMERKGTIGKQENITICSDIAPRIEHMFATICLKNQLEKPWQDFTIKNLGMYVISDGGYGGLSLDRQINRQ
jgi:hypothetical protein